MPTNRMTPEQKVLKRQKPALTPQYTAEVIKIPLARWPGNCYAVASQMVKQKLVAGRAAYGHYRGTVRYDCVVPAFYHSHNTMGWVRHGWILCKDGSVVDPTRWVFEKQKPYIYKGPLNEEYDEGGNIFLQENMQPPPEYDPEARVKVPAPRNCEMYKRLREWMFQYVQPQGGKLTHQQIHWLATLPLPFLGEVAPSLYSWICTRKDCAGLIPIDNRRIVLGKEKSI